MSTWRPFSGLKHHLECSSSAQAQRRRYPYLCFSIAGSPRKGIVNSALWPGQLPVSRKALDIFLCLPKVLMSPMHGLKQAQVVLRETETP